jgi:hypothetical protein
MASTVLDHPSLTIRNTPIEIKRAPTRKGTVTASRNKRALKATTKKGYVISKTEAVEAPSKRMAEYIK